MVKLRFHFKRNDAKVSFQTQMSFGTEIKRRHSIQTGKFGWQ